MEIFFVTGKGGVGKSTVAAAYAYFKSLKGKKTLLVELGDQSFYKDSFELPNVGYNPLQLQENLEISLWTGEECLKEYALHLIKVESLYRLFLENQVSKSLINIAPALPELAILGKITSGPPRNVGPKMDYDCIVVDAYSSGHFLALLNAPKGMAEAVGFGPMGDQTRAIQKIISDPEICQYVVVSLPEELPTSEAIELSEKIESAIGIKPIHYMNRCLNLTLDEIKIEDGVPKNFRTHIEKNILRQKEMLQKLKEKNIEANILPWIFQQKSWEIVSRLSKEIHS